MYNHLYEKRSIIRDSFDASLGMIEYYNEGLNNFFHYVTHLEQR